VNRPVQVSFTPAAWAYAKASASLLGICPEEAVGRALALHRAVIENGLAGGRVLLEGPGGALRELTVRDA
jgi:hypothetical protein